MFGQFLVFYQTINMTILQLINGEKVNFLHVNVLKQISSTQYIVGDKTGLAIMHVLSEQSSNIDVGKGLKMVKPSLQTLTKPTKPFHTLPMVYLNLLNLYKILLNLPNCYKNPILTTCGFTHLYVPRTCCFIFHWGCL